MLLCESGGKQSLLKDVLLTLGAVCCLSEGMHREFMNTEAPGVRHGDRHHAVAPDQNGRCRIFQKIGEERHTRRGTWRVKRDICYLGEVEEKIKGDVFGVRTSTTGVFGRPNRRTGADEARSLLHVSRRSVLKGVENKEQLMSPAAPLRKGS